MSRADASSTGLGARALEERYPDGVAVMTTHGREEDEDSSVNVAASLLAQRYPMADVGQQIVIHRYTQPAPAAFFPSVGAPFAGGPQLPQQQSRLVPVLRGPLPASVAPPAPAGSRLHLKGQTPGAAAAFTKGVGSKILVRKSDGKGHPQGGATMKGASSTTAGGNSVTLKGRQIVAMWNRDAVGGGTARLLPAAAHLNLPVSDVRLAGDARSQGWEWSQEKNNAQGAGVVGKDRNTIGRSGTGKDRQPQPEGEAVANSVAPKGANKRNSRKSTGGARPTAGTSVPVAKASRKARSASASGGPDVEKRNGAAFKPNESRFNIPFGAKNKSDLLPTQYYWVPHGEYVYTVGFLPSADHDKNGTPPPLPPLFDLSGNGMILDANERKLQAAKPGFTSFYIYNPQAVSGTKEAQNKLGVVNVPTHEIKKLDVVTPDQLQGIEDVSRLQTVSNGGILETVRTRFLTQGGAEKESAGAGGKKATAKAAMLTYTGVEKVLIAVNPYKWIPGAYGRDVIARYPAFSEEKFAAVSGSSEGATVTSSSTGEPGSGRSISTAASSNRGKSPDSVFKSVHVPHCYRSARGAYIGMSEHGKSQAILISGESGAGKTETAKLVLHYFATVSASLHGSLGSSRDSSLASTAPQSSLEPSSTISGGGSRQDLERRILAASPIMEAFGNAKTLRNNNSSRFGKWIELYFTGASSGGGKANDAVVNTANKIDVGNNVSRTLSGAKIVDYLLETTRLVEQTAGERSFHIFYELCQTRGEQVSRFNYLNGSQTDKTAFNLAERDDAKEHADLRSAFETAFGEQPAAGGVVNTDSLAAGEVFDLCMGLLYLGNVGFAPLGPTAKESRRRTEFGSGDACEVAKSSETDLETAMALFGVNMRNERKLVHKALTSRRIYVRNQGTTIGLSPEKAKAGRDALVKLYYGKLFTLLVERLNRAIALPQVDAPDPTDPTGTRSRPRKIGVLDIAGFEAFEKNGLEQLLFNLSNEALQQHFNYSVFRSEMAEFAKEQVQLSTEGAQILNWKEIDNSEVLDLLWAPRHGVLELLNDEVKLATPSAAHYVDQLVRRYANKDLDGKNAHIKGGFRVCMHPRFVKEKFGNKQTNFGIVHYAGTVYYAADNWVEKNLDTYPKEAVDLLELSERKLMKTELLKTVLASGVEGNEGNDRAPAAGGEGNESAALGGGLQPSTRRIVLQPVARTFILSLQTLLKTISTHEPHFIRCIKPNMHKDPKSFESRLVYEQLLNTGLIECVRIRQLGFPTRMLYAEFIRKYLTPLVGKTGPPEKDDVARIRKFVEKVLRTEIYGGRGENKAKKHKGMYDFYPEFLQNFAYRAMAKAGFENADFVDKYFAFGTTKIFLKTDAVQTLDQLLRFRGRVAQIQATVKMFLKRRVFVRLRGLLRKLRDKVGELKDVDSLTQHFLRRAMDEVQTMGKLLASGDAELPIAEHLAQLMRQEADNLEKLLKSLKKQGRNFYGVPRKTVLDGREEQGGSGKQTKRDFPAHVLEDIECLREVIAKLRTETNRLERRGGLSDDMLLCTDTELLRRYLNEMRDYLEGSTLKKLKERLELLEAQKPIIDECKRLRLLPDSSSAAPAAGGGRRSTKLQIPPLDARKSTSAAKSTPPRLSYIPPVLTAETAAYQNLKQRIEAAQLRSKPENWVLISPAEGEYLYSHFDKILLEIALFGGLENLCDKRSAVAAARTSAAMAMAGRSSGSGRGLNSALDMDAYTSQLQVLDESGSAKASARGATPSGRRPQQSIEESAFSGGQSLLPSVRGSDELPSLRTSLAARHTTARSQNEERRTKEGAVTDVVLDHHTLGSLYRGSGGSEDPVGTANRPHRAMVPGFSDSSDEEGLTPYAGMTEFFREGAKAGSKSVEPDSMEQALRKNLGATSKVGGINFVAYADEAAVIAFQEKLAAVWNPRDFNLSTEYKRALEEVVAPFAHERFALNRGGEERLYDPTLAGMYLAARAHGQLSTMGTGQATISQTLLWLGRCYRHLPITCRGCQTCHGRGRLTPRATASTRLAQRYPSMMRKSAQILEELARYAASQILRSHFGDKKEAQ
eukprot:g12533.t1